MKNIKDYIGESLVGKTFHFVCDCLLPFDFVGKVTDYEVADELILIVMNGDRPIRIGINHPKLKLEEIKG